MEPAIANVTRHKSLALPLQELKGMLEWLLAVKVTYDLSESGVAKLAQNQIDLLGADLLVGEPEKACPRCESELAPFKPRADAVCVGKAYAPNGVPIPECIVGFGVGSWFKTIRVIGNRRWMPALAGLTHRMTEPEPFKSIEVSYENAYGGKDLSKPESARCYPVNPVGKGYSEGGSTLNGLALPNLENPSDPIKSWRNRPWPISFGPVGRTWEPRILKVGTYDRRWLKERAPRLPEDFDPAYYNCAPADQQIQGYLRGDEEVRVQNMHPKQPDFRFRLPGIRIRALSDKRMGARNQLEEITMNLDTLWVDMEALKLVLVWRGRIKEDPAQGQGTVLIVEETLASSPRLPESYRPELVKHAAEEQEADRTIEAAEKELDEVTKPVTATP